MKRFLILLLLLTTSCASLPTEWPAPLSTAVSPAESFASETPTSQPVAGQRGVIHVNSFEQEVHPYINNGNCTLGEAIVAANTLQNVDACPAGLAEGSIIELEAGTYLLEAVDPSPAFHLDGSPWDRAPNQMAGLPVVMGKVTINGSGAVISANRNTIPILLITYSPQAILNDLTLTGGGLELDSTYTYSYDAGNYWNAGSAVLNRVRVENGIADNGAGIANGNGSLELADCVVSGNAARYAGGGIRNYGSLKITASVIENNTANNGAGISLHGGDVMILNSEIRGNGAKGGGGGILIDPLRKPVALVIQESRIAGNSANEVKGMGGGILLSYDYYANFEITDHSADVADIPSATVDLINAQVTNNVSAGGGGIAWGGLPDSQLTISQGSLFAGNRAVSTAYGGGAIFNYHGSIQVEGSTFTGNTSFNGGAIYTRAGILAITGSVFDANVTETNEKDSPAAATGFGGAILNEGGQLSVDETVFRKNLALFGGAVYYSHPSFSRCVVNSDSFTKIKNSCFLSNDASYDVTNYPQGDQIFLQQCLNPAKNPSLEAVNNWWGTASLPDENQVFGNVSLEPVLSSAPAYCQ